MHTARPGRRRSASYHAPTRPHPSPASSPPPLLPFPLCGFPLVLRSSPSPTPGPGSPTLPDFFAAEARATREPSDPDRPQHEYGQRVTPRASDPTAGEGSVQLQVCTRA